MGEVWLNGQWLALEKAQISVLDRGFLFGDGVYEVIPVFSGKAFRLAAHLRRLRYSLEQTRIVLDWDDERWQALLQRLIDSHGGGDQSLYLQVTRGVAPQREHRFPDAVEPTVFAMSRPLPPPPHEAPAPINCVLREDLRWQRCDIKSTSLLGNVLLTQQALDADAREALLVRDNRLWEGASSNVFVVLAGRIYTAPAGDRILGGITRDLLVELLNADGCEVIEEAVPVNALGVAEEVWITSSTREMVPVIEIDGRAVADGSPGPVFQRLWAQYHSYRQQHCPEAP